MFGNSFVANNDGDYFFLMPKYIYR